MSFVFFRIRPFKVRVERVVIHQPVVRTLLTIMAGGAIKGEAWSPSGGWFFVPKNWKPNTMITLGGLAIFGALTLAVGSKLQYQSNTAETDETIAKWNAAAAKARQASAVKETQGSE